MGFLVGLWIVIVFRIVNYNDVGVGSGFRVGNAPGGFFRIGNIVGKILYKTRLAPVAKSVFYF